MSIQYRIHDEAPFFSWLIAYFRKKEKVQTGSKIEFSFDGYLADEQIEIYHEV